MLAVHVWHKSLNAQVTIYQQAACMQQKLFTDTLKKTNNYITVFSSLADSRK